MFKSRPSGGMLGSVGAKIAHASTIPSLGNPDLRTLQDLITAEKGVLTSVQRLAGDVGKGAEMLRNWGVGEGDDLGDVLSHSTNLLAQFSAALTQFASYEEQVRTQLKSIRTREEGLDEMRRRKRTVDHKADAADKKLAKMGPEHKGRQAQVELLNELKEEGRRLEIDIMNEEAAIGDYKRRTTREFMALKFAAMVELAEKATIIGDLGKLMIEEIPMHTTPPGHPRAPYSGREKTSELSSEAMRCISEIRLNLPSLPESAPAPTFEAYSPNGAPVPGGDYTQGTFGSSTPRGQGFYNEFGETERPSGSTFSAGSLRIGDDGSRIGNTGAGQFNTLPASGSGFSGGLPPITLADHGREDTFSSSVADALAHDANYYGQKPPSPPPQPAAPPSTYTPPPHPPAATSSYTPPPHPPSVPTGTYTPPPHPPSVPTGTYAPPPGPPPGALPPVQPSHSYFGQLPDLAQPSSPLVPPNAFSSPWANASPPKQSRPLPSYPPQEPAQEVDDGRTDLAYARDPSPVPPSPTPAQPTHGQTTADSHLPNPYADTTRNRTPSPQPARDQSPVRDQDQEHRDANNAAVREVSREMDALAMAPYASSPPRRQSMGFSSPPKIHAQPASYGPTPGSTYAPSSGSPFGPPAGSPYAPSPAQEPTSSPPPSGSTYGTPSEHPNPFSAPLPRPPTLPQLPSGPSISSPPPGSPTATGRTISAGAFRRNVSRSDTLDAGMSAGVPPPVSPLAVRKKTLGGEDVSRGSSPAPASPGAPPTYSAIDDYLYGEESTSPPATGGFGNADSKPLPRPQ